MREKGDQVLSARPAPIPPPRPKFLFACAVGLAVIFAAMSRLPTHRASVPLYLALYASAFVIYAIAAAALARRNCRCSLPVILLFAALFHALLVPSAPLLSTDVYRYLWEGRLTLHRVNPLLTPPDAPALKALRDTDWKNVNNKAVSSIYPTTSQAFFVLSSRIAPGSLILWKALMSGCDLGAAIFLAAWLRRRGLPPQRCLLYAWNPLPITEFALNGHQDAIGIAALCAGFWLIALGPGRSSQPRLPHAAAGAVFALSIFAKGYALLCLPYLRRQGKTFWLTLAASSMALTAPLFYGFRIGALADAPKSTGAVPWSGLHIFALEWERNDSFFRLIRIAADAVGVHPELAARVTTTALFLALAIWLWVGKRNHTVESSCLGVFGAFLLLGPTLYPWYVAWLIPLAIVARRPSWLVLSGLVALDYLSGYYGRELIVVLITEYLLFYLCLLADYARHPCGDSREQAPGNGEFVPEAPCQI
ncbi:MAG TPA: hypothetical protein VFJ58_17625 [Armatimonadota bacterium]|nr:hypothetical protein [Armatimonadota bacterium]